MGEHRATQHQPGRIVAAEDDAVLRRDADQAVAGVERVAHVEGRHQFVSGDLGMARAADHHQRHAADGRTVDDQRVGSAEPGAVDRERAFGGVRRVEGEVVAEAAVELQGRDVDHRLRAEHQARGIIALKLDRTQHVVSRAGGPAVDAVVRRQRRAEIEDVVTALAEDGVVAALRHVEMVVARRAGEDVVVGRAGIVGHDLVARASRCLRRSYGMPTRTGNKREPAADLFAMKFPRRVAVRGNIAWKAGFSQRRHGRLIPFMMLLYVCNFLDRVNVGFAALTMNKDLAIGAEAFGIVGGIFFIGYFLFEVPSNVVLEKTGARFWIFRIMLTWGLVSMATAFVTGPESLGALRFPARHRGGRFFPGVIFYLGLWFPAEMRARFVGLFLCAISLANIVGAPLSGLILGMDGMAA